MIEKLGRYEILEEIGQGGFATVYRGRDTELDRMVALKELRRSLLKTTEWVTRFKREAKTIARLDHPRIVTLFDATEISGRLFIVMRLVDGSSLDTLLETQAPLPWQQTVEIITAIAEGLSNQQIAERLTLAEGTVKYYTRQIYGKLQVRNRTQAVNTARDLGLV